MTDTPPPIYLDYAATSPVLPAVLDAMLPYFTEHFGNPGSVHRWGQAADKGLRAARRTLATVLNCQPSEIIFTSGGSESDNLALRGVMFAARAAGKGQHLITTAIEHSAVLTTARQLHEQHGFALTILPVDQYGRVSAGQVAAALRPDTALVSVIWGNNEIGTLNPIAEIAAICRAHGVLFHTDAVQAAAYLPTDVPALGVDLLSIGGHKAYGPKGIGALYARFGVPLTTQITGGSQEEGRRAGTSLVPLAVGLATAFELAQAERAQRTAHVSALRDALIAGVLAALPGQAQLTGHPTDRLPNHASFALQHTDGNDLLMQLDLAGIAASSGSACKTGNPEPSDTLIALGLDPTWTLGSLRLTVGLPTTPAEIERALAVLPGAVARARRA